MPMDSIDSSHGFLVDNFRGHKIGDVNHPDYRVCY